MTSYIHLHEWEADRRRAEALRASEKRQYWHLDGGVLVKTRGLLYRLTHRQPVRPKSATSRPSLKRAS